VDETLKRIVDNVRVCVDGQIRVMHVPQPAADATRPIALRALLRAIENVTSPKHMQETK
jgi:hypothetical protein